MSRVLVCGGRDFTDYRSLHAVLAALDVSLLIHGGATGADWIAGDWANVSRIPVRVFPADWKRDGKAAGPLRNQRMLDEGKPDLVVACSGGRGTADMVRRAKAAGVEVAEILATEAARGTTDK